MSKVLRVHALLVLGLLALFIAPAAFAKTQLESVEDQAEMNPDNPDAWFNFAGVALQMGKPDIAAKAVKKLVALAPKDALAWELKGQIHMAQGKEDEAVEAYHKAVDLNSKLASAWAQLAKLQAQKGDPDSLQGALKAFEMAYKSNPKDIKLLLNQGVIAGKLGDDKKALKIFEKAEGLPGGKELAARYLCQLYAKTGETKSAEKACEKASKSDKAGAETLYNLGYAQSRNGKKEQARKSYQKAVGIDGQFAPALYSLGLLEYEAGNLKKALEIFQTASASRQGDYPEAQYATAVVLGDLGDWKKAAGLYRDILKKDSDNEDAKANLAYVVESGSEALLNRGKDLYQEGQYDEAVAAWKGVLELDGSNKDAAEFLAKAKKKSVKSSAALAAKKDAKTQVASKLKSQDAKVLVDGRAALKKGDLAAAVRLLDFYVKKNPGDKKAASDFYKAKTQRNQQVDEYLQVAGRELVNDNKAKAKEVLLKVLALDPANQRAEKMMAQVTGSASQAKVSAEALKKQYFQGVDAYLDGDLAKAIGLWKGVLDKDANHLDARRSLSQAELELEALQKRK